MCRSVRTTLAAIAALLVMAAVDVAVAEAAGSLIISEIRLRGPASPDDEFIEIYNDSATDHLVTATSGTGYGIAASDGVVRCTIPNGTVIPAGGYFLCVNLDGYSLANYAAGSGTTATGDGFYTVEIDDNVGIALFDNNSGGLFFTLANRFDAVGSTSELNTLYKEGAGYPPLVPPEVDYSFVRDECGKGGAVNQLGACTIETPKDTGDNAVDFYFVETNGSSRGAGQRLGAAGPQGLSSPIQQNGAFLDTLLDTCVSASSPPNRIRDLTGDSPGNATFGTLDIRRTFTNGTGADVGSLRFRVIDLSTFPAASGFADLRPKHSTAVVVAVDRPPCGAGTSNVTVEGVTLEGPPDQPNGGGFNSSLGAGSVTLGAPLAAGASIDLHFLLGVQQTGNFRIWVNVEALPVLVP